MFYKKYGSSMSNSMQNIFIKKIIVVIFINLILHILAFFSYKYNLYLFSTFIRYFFAVSSILLLFYIFIINNSIFIKNKKIILNIVNWLLSIFLIIMSINTVLDLKVHSGIWLIPTFNLTLSIFYISLAMLKNK